MRDVLKRLCELNPELKLYSVTDPEFAPYGRILELGSTAELDAAMTETVVPAMGNTYCANDEKLFALEICRRIGRIVFGGMPIETGYCNGYGNRLNALEYHKCSEINYSLTGCVLLLARPEQLHDGNLDSSGVVGFYLPPRVMIEVYPRVLHFAPCRVSADPFNCLVILEAGVNTPLDRVNVKALNEEKLLWMRGKWLTAHAESVPASKGAYVGISGQNICLKGI